VGNIKHLRPSVGNIQTNTQYGVEGGIVHPISLCMDCYSWLHWQYTQWVNLNATEMRMKNCHYTLAFFLPHTARSIATAAVVHCMRSHCNKYQGEVICVPLQWPWQTSRHRVGSREDKRHLLDSHLLQWSDTSVNPHKNAQFEATHRTSFCLENVTHKQLVRVGKVPSHLSVLQAVHVTVAKRDALLAMRIWA